VITPHTIACPEGITRGTVIELCGRRGLACNVRDVSLAELYRCDEAFCTGTMGELVPVKSIDGRLIGSGHPGPTYCLLANLFQEEVRSSGTLVIE